MPVDIHAHYVPRSLLSAVEARGTEIGVRLLRAANEGPPTLAFDYGFTARPFFPQLIEDVAARRASLAQMGLDRQLVATWPDIYGYGLKPAACAAWHRVLNDTLGAWCDANRDCFSFVASVPLTNAADAAAELERALGLGAVGVMVPANVESTNIGELQLDPFWERAQALGLPVILHPVLTAPSPRAARFALAQIVQYPFDTTLGLGSLIFSGTLDRFPRLALVLAHGGGAFPFLAGRFDFMHERMDRSAQGNAARQKPSAYARRMSFDSIVHSPTALRFLIEVAGLETVVLGTDYSFPPAEPDPLGALNRAGLTAAEIEQVVEVNPRRIFSHLARF